MQVFVCFPIECSECGRQFEEGTVEHILIRRFDRCEECIKEALNRIDNS